LNCCDPKQVGELGTGQCVDADATEQAVAAYESAGIDTYVVGMPGSEAYGDVLGRLDTILAENEDSLHDTIANIDSFAGALARNSNRVDGILQGLERLTGGWQVGDGRTMRGCKSTCGPRVRKARCGAR